MASRREFLRRCGGIGLSMLPVPLAGQPAGAPGFRLVDVTAAAGLQFRHNSGAYGGKLLPETLGAGCAFLDYDADGWQDILLVNGMDWPGHRRQRSNLSSLSEQSERHVHGRHARGRSGRRDVRDGSRCRRFQQRRLHRRAGDLRRAEPAVPQHGPGHVRRRHHSQRSWRTNGVQHVGDVDRRRSRRLPRSVRLQLCQVVRRARRLLQPRRQAEVVLHSGGVPRRDVLAVPQQGQRHVRGRHRDVRHLRLELEVAGGCAARSRPRWMAGHLRRQRHAAEQALSQSAERYVQGRRPRVRDCA